MLSSILVALAAVGAHAAPFEERAIGGKNSLAGRATSLTTSPKLVSNGCTYPLPGLGQFTQAIDLDFTSLSSLPSSLKVSTNTINAGTSPFARQFMSANVGISSGKYITLTVPGGQDGTSAISSAEIQTGEKDILYGSVRTVAKTSTVAGTTHGFSFYSNDTQESDIAFLTSDLSSLHLTNEQTSYGSNASSFSVSAPSDAATAWHEYRLDWVPGKTMFYIDSTLVYTITDNVPSTPGFLLWNNWSNGNAWAKGPPQANNVLQIQSITAYFNQTSVTPDPNSNACRNSYSTYVSASQACELQGLNYTDSNGVKWTTACNSDVVGQGDVGVASTSSFTACLTACGAFNGCNAVAYVGGSGPGACYFKDLRKTKVAPNSNPNVDIGYIASSYLWASSNSNSNSNSNSKNS